MEEAREVLYSALSWKDGGCMISTEFCGEVGGWVG